MCSASELTSLAISAHQDLPSWARFVALTEFAWQDRALVSDAAQWQALWFEMEIVHALALAEWEEQGSPVNWRHQWCVGYQADAQSLLSQLLHLIARQG